MEVVPGVGTEWETHHRMRLPLSCDLCGISPQFGRDDEARCGRRAEYGVTPGKGRTRLSKLQH